MKVLSLFDGMSCCRLALEKLDIPVEKYYASEIDKYAIQVTQANYPDTEQLGDVTAWQTWELDWASIDLVTGGFPCQAWSLAGKQLGDKDERGKLFWTMLDVMAKVMEHNPKAFYLMENVKMKKEFESYITYHTEQALPNVYKYLINSALVSAQSRQRYYWTNIPGVEQPEDRGIVLRDILEHETDESHFVGADLHKNYQGGKQLNPTYKSQANTIHDSSDKSATLAAGTHGYANGYVENPTADLVGKGGKKMLKKDIQKATALMARDYKGWNTYGMTEVRTKPKQVGIAADINGHDVLKRVYSPEGKSPTLNSMGGGNREPKVVSGGAFRGRAYDQNGKRKDRDGKSVANQTKQMLELRKDDKSNAITTVSKDSVVVSKKVNLKKYNDEIAINPRNFGGKGYVGTDKKSVALTQPSGNNATLVRAKKDSVVVSNKPNQINPSKKASGKQPYMQERVFHKEGKSHALTREFASRTHIGETNELTWRKLTPNECMALQTVRSDYLMPVSNTQKFKLLGNGWTVEVIAHIFTFMQRAHNGEHLVTKGQQSLDL